jgi:hypothetical protein|nr:MAG TPA: hypothetical protein [Bacteriophage sp.]
MACISKLTSAINYDCDSGATGLVSAIIINKSDIASFTSDASGVATITLAPGAKAYKIDTVKRSLVLSTALKINDGAPNANTHTANMTVTYADQTSVLSYIMNAFTNGSFVIVAKTANSSARAGVYGLYYGLSATGIDRSSHDNGGWTTVTLETPENVIGEDTCFMEVGPYQALLDAAVG